MLLASLLAVGFPIAAATVDVPKITHDWPGYTGPEGTFADQSKVPILDDLSRARLVWVSEHDDLGYGKTSSGGGHCYGNFNRPSGSGSLIIAGGRVVAGYFNAKNGVMADDVILALDAATGKTKWKQVFTDKGINRGAGKHLNYGPTPVAGDGKVFHLGTSGRVYCVDLGTGRPLWESDVGDEHKALEEVKERTRAFASDQIKVGIGGADALVPTASEEAKKAIAVRPRMAVTPLMVIDGVAMVTVDSLYGFDGTTGKKLWQIAGATSVQSVPCPVRLNGTMYAFCSGGDGNMRLIRPKTGEVIWKEFLGASFLPIVADGRAFVPRLKDPAKPAPRGERPSLTAFALSETGAKMLWQSDFPMDGDSWNAYRDGVIYASAAVYQPAGGKIMAFKAEDGTLLGMYDDKEGDRGRFHVWGDRLVVVGDNHHESINAPCYYWALTPGVKDLAKSGKPHLPRFRVGYRGVNGYEVLMRDPFADGYQFTRAIDTAQGKGVIKCWDLRARAESASRRLRIDAPLRGFPKQANSGTAEALLADDTITHFIYDFPVRTANGEVKPGGQPQSVLLKEPMAFAHGRAQGEVPVTVLGDNEDWKLNIQTDGGAVSGTYERKIPALKQTHTVEGSAAARTESRSGDARRWTIQLAQAISRDLGDAKGQKKDMSIVIDRLPDGQTQGWARGIHGGVHELDVSRYEANDTKLVLTMTVLLHSDAYVSPTVERRGTVAMEVVVTLAPDGEAWKGTYTVRHGIAWSCQGTIGGK